MSNLTDNEIQTLLAELWQRYLPTTHERLNVLDRAAAEASFGTLSEEARVEAQSVAHKLAGNLGMFGHPEAGNLASEIEDLLKSPAPASLADLTASLQRLREALAPYL